MSDPNDRWLRLTEFYWGAPRPRLSRLTLRIMGLNAATLLVLVAGFLALAPYQESLISARLDAFSRQALLVSVALEQAQDPQKRKDSLKAFAPLIGADIFVYNKKRILIAINHAPELQDTQTKSAGREALVFLRTLLDLLPRPTQQALPPWPGEKDPPPGLTEALMGRVFLAAWGVSESSSEKLRFSVSVPLKDGGAVIFATSGAQIEADIREFWISLFQVFGLTLAFTTALSIYLSGAIARPLRGLAKAAEHVACGRMRVNAIPDLAYRRDEIGELSLALRAMAAALASRADLTARFAADVAHELKNPLASAQAALEVLETAPLDKKQDLMAIVRADIERMNRRITDISRACRVEAALSCAAFAHVDMARLVPQEAVFVTPGPFWVEGQDGPLTQVLDNLLANAYSFSDDVRVTLAIEGKEVVLRVEDCGPGIPPGREEAIFERFYSERRGNAADGDHSGLGLAIVRDIVRAHGGTITGQNKPSGDGAVFTLRLPLARI